MKDEIFGCVEYPKEQSEVTRGMKIQGWAFSASGQDTNIEIYVDGHYIKEIQTGIPRFDVEKSHPKFNEVAYTSGFLTKILMPEVSVYDYHTLEIRAKNKEFSKTIGVIKIKLNTKIIEEVWPDEGMTVHFRDAGIEAFAYMKKLCDLRPDFHVLDIGCQLGRIAVQLSRFLNNDGRYEGFDIIEEVVAWCKNHITAKYPNFNFFVADIYNGWYNSSGKFQPYEYKFPYTDSSFDFVIAFSVFTHMFYKEMENYFREISRVLKKGGQCWLTFTILDDESLRCLESKITLCDFNYKFNGYRSTRNDNPEASIAWEEGIIRRLCKEYELSIKEPIIPGSWRGIKRETPLWQDIIIVSRN